MSGLIGHLRIAAEGGDASAQFNLGIFYDNGLDDNGHDADRNRREAIKWLHKAAQQGLARAQSKLADIYSEDSDVEPAYAWLLVAAANADSTNGQNIQTRLDRMSARLTAEQLDRAKKTARSWTGRITGKIERIVQGDSR